LTVEGAIAHGEHALGPLKVLPDERNIRHLHFEVLQLHGRVLWRFSASEARAFDC
jgi:hypothetical protein